MKFLKYLLGLLSIAALAGLAVYMYIFGSKNVKPETFVLYIPTGADYATVVDTLRYRDVLRSYLSFGLASTAMKYDKLVKPGRYIIHQSMSNRELIEMLRSGRQEPVRVTFNNIAFFEELSSILSNYLEPDSADFSNYFLNPENAKSFGFKSETFQLMYIPDTYEFFWNTSPENFSKKMNSYYQKFWSEENKVKAKKIGLSPEQVGILASIVESETKKRDEMPTVAGLYLNRLKMNMPLQADPTVVYATMMERGSRSRRVYFKDLKTDSPYNTYLYRGLPPGPILFPTQVAMQAVLNAHEHKYLYMCADPDRPGYHLFTSDYQQHLRNAARYHRWLNTRQIN